jgi:hypothetical protein
MPCGRALPIGTGIKASPWNPEVNKSRVIQVERLNFLISYEKNSDRINYGCFGPARSSAGEGSRCID